MCINETHKVQTIQTDNHTLLQISFKKLILQSSILRFFPVMLNTTEEKGYGPGPPWTTDIATISPAILKS